MMAPNFRHGGDCCCNCEHGHLVGPNKIAGTFNVMVNCKKYGLVPPGGLCDDWEED